VVVVTAYTFLGGFKAVCWTDLFQGILMFLAIIVVALFMYRGLGSSDFEWSQLGRVTLGTSKEFGMMGIVGAIAWGLGYFGQPHILARFMAIKSSKEIKPARRIAMVWVVISLALAVLIGMLANPFLKLIGMPLAEGAEETVFMVLVQHMFPTVVAGILLAAVLAAIMSTADSQLLVASSSFSSDIYNTLFDKNASEKKLLNVSRLAIIIIALIACLLALDPNSSVFEIVSHAWAGFGAAFGPIILCSLFWKRCNEKGALAGVISGGAVSLLWAYVPKAIWGANIPGIFSIYEIVPGFIVSLALIFIVSLATKAPSKEVIEEFESVKNADI
jgi:sodium/proline symporter